MDSRKKIEILHNLVFPLEEFDFDYVKTCKNIKSAIRQMCLKQQKELKIPILMIGRFLEVDIYELRNSFSLNLCETIQNKILDICLTLEEYEKNLIVLSEKGIPSHVGKNNNMICESYFDKARYRFFLMELYYPGRLNYKSPYDKENSEEGIFIEKVYKNIYKGGDSRKSGENFELFKDIIDRLEPNSWREPTVLNDEEKQFFLKTIDFDLDAQKVNKGYKANRDSSPLTPQEQNFLIELHDKIRKGKIPLNIYDVCDYF